MTQQIALIALIALTLDHIWSICTTTCVKPHWKLLCAIMQRTILIDLDKAKAAVGRQGSPFQSVGATVANVGPVQIRWLLGEGGTRIRGQVPRLSTAFDIARRLVARSHPSVARCRPPLRHVVGADADASSSRFCHRAGVWGLGEGLMAVGIESADTASDGFYITT